jgi:UDP-N-acetyl-D-mannosaminuronate dehydrogenase
MKVRIIGFGYVGLPLVLHFRGVTRGIEASNLVRL